MNRILRPTSLALALAIAGCHEPSVPVLSTPVPVAQAAASEFVVVTTPEALSPAATCNFEQLDKQPFAAAPIAVKAGAEFLITGYFYSEATQSVPAESRLRAISEDGTRTLDAVVSGRYNRPDVPGYFHLGDWANRSGFEQLVSSKALLPGDYHLLLLFYDKGVTFYCDNGRHIVVSP